MRQEVRGARVCPRHRLAAQQEALADRRAHEGAVAHLRIDLADPHPVRPAGDATVEHPELEARVVQRTLGGPAGAQIEPDAETIFAAAEMIVKVKEPQPIEIARLKPHHVLFTYLHLAPDPEQAAGLVPIEDSVKSKLETVVDKFVSELVAADANSPETQSNPGV